MKHDNEDLRASVATLLRLATLSTPASAYEDGLGIKLVKLTERTEANGATFYAYSYTGGRGFSLNVSQLIFADRTEIAAIDFAPADSNPENCLRLGELKSLALRGGWGGPHVFFDSASHGFKADKPGLELTVTSLGGLGLDGIVPDADSDAAKARFAALEDCAVRFSILNIKEN